MASETLMAGFWNASSGFIWACLTVNQRGSVLLQHAKREGIAETAAWKDWKVVEHWVVADFVAERETILPRLNHMRMNLIASA